MGGGLLTLGRRSSPILESCVEALPDLATLSDPELRDLIRELMDEERQVSYQRRILHGKIDILRAELQARLKKQVGEGKSPLTEVDVDKLTEILASKAPPPADEELTPEAVTYVHCPECGFQNPEAANYCSKCGALLIHDEPGAHTTMTFTPEEDAEDDSLSLADLRIEGPALVVRAGGGRAGETFALEGDRVASGAHPSARSSSTT